MHCMKSHSNAPCFGIFDDFVFKERNFSLADYLNETFKAIPFKNYLLLGKLVVFRKIWYKHFSEKQIVTLTCYSSIYLHIKLISD